METPPSQLPDLWTVDQLADYLGCPKSYVYRLTHERRIRFVRVGKTVRFRPDDVEAWLAGATVEPAPAPARRGRPRRPRQAA